MLRLLPLLALPALASLGCLGELVRPGGEDLALLLVLSLSAVAVDCLFGKRGKRSNVLVFALICLLLYSAQLALLLTRRLHFAARAAMPQVDATHHVKLVPKPAAPAPATPAPAPETPPPLHSMELPSEGGVVVHDAPATPAPASRNKMPDFGGVVIPVRQMKTISIVLPCAEERTNALNTVMRFCERTPADVLTEIIVVDDGSNPPMTEVFAKDERRLDKNPKCGLRILRHEQTIGLMAAKLTGGKAAKGDVIGFFDCHCSPKPLWHEEILQRVSAHPKAMVVPAITDLDMDNFDERVNSAVNAKCYLTFDADFKWFDDESDYIPTISGGLVAMGREWFNLTGGFDEEMHGWGGENLDQSLRAWLCGGEIVRASSSRIAHMWRTGDPRTRTHYRVKARGTDNRGRVAAAWFDEFLPVYRGRKMEHNAVANYDAVKKRLGCMPFAYFIYRFRRVYIEGGVVAKEAFHLKEKKSGLCLRHSGITGAIACREEDRSQKFQRGNVDRASGKCCSGLRAFGSNDCMDYFNEQGGHYYSCDVSGQNMNQQANLRPDGRIIREHDECIYVASGEDNEGGKRNVMKGMVVRKKACSQLRPDEGIFEKVFVVPTEEWKIYDRELKKHKYEELLPDLPDN